MIKGSIEERMEYEDYIRSLKDSIRFPFRSIYDESQKIIRYYWIKKTKENREFEPKEIQILHLMSLIDTAVRIGGLIYTWWWEEHIPEMIFTLPQSKADWFVPVEDMAKTFMQVPTKTIEAALLKSQAPRDVIHKSLKAQREDNIDALVEQLSIIPIDNIFEAYKLINAYNQQSQVFSHIALFDKNTERKTLYSLADAFETLKPDDSVCTTDFIDKVSVFAKSIELDDQDVVNNPEPYIFALCMGIQLTTEIFKDDLGSSNPVAETMREITEEPAFQKIYNRYVQFPRDADRCMAFCRKLLHWMNGNLGINMSDEDLVIETSDAGNNKPIIYSSSRRLEFPTRISRNKSMDIGIKKEILSGLFKEFGYNFENFDGDSITEDEFIYLFDGPVKRPENYETPYYWNNTDKQFAGLLRLLYLGQARGINEIILLIKDKGSKTSSVKWSTKKQGLGKTTLLSIEEKIQDVVFKVTGARLPDVDLTKQNKSRPKSIEI
ncbi:MAG: hypothetical protein K2F69_05455 [Bacteroidaceae bacterium]|nr:hypothetical protein [Bacteroidaceae bacterium]